MNTDNVSFREVVNELHKVVRILNIIKVMSHECHGVANDHHTDCLFNSSLFIDAEPSPNS